MAHYRHGRARFRPLLPGPTANYLTTRATPRRNTRARSSSQKRLWQRWVRAGGRRAYFFFFFFFLPPNHVARQRERRRRVQSFRLHLVPRARALRRSWPGRARAAGRLDARRGARPPAARSARGYPCVSEENTNVVGRRPPPVNALGAFGRRSGRWRKAMAGAATPRNQYGAMRGRVCAPAFDRLPTSRPSRDRCDRDTAGVRILGTYRQHHQRIGTRDQRLLLQIERGAPSDGRCGRR